MSQIGSPISKAEFEKMRKAYDEKHPGQTQFVRLSSSEIKKVLDTPGTAAVRIYFGIDEDGRNTVMLVAENIDKAAALSGDGEGPILNRGQLCPPYCS